MSTETIISNEEDERAPLTYEELVERFRAKVGSIPEECHEAIMLWKMAREVQSARIAGENNIRQVLETVKKVFWGDEIPENIKRVMLRGEDKQLSDLRKYEDTLARGAEKAFKNTRWYNEVAIPAAEGVGLGPMLAGQLLWQIGCASRFPSFGRIVRYAGLDVTQEGKAPKRRKGARITWSPELRTALFKLTEVWNKMPESVWRARWDGIKAWYREKYPEKEVYEEGGKKKTRYNDGHIHNMARRKVQREFLRNLYHLWIEYENEDPEVEKKYPMA